MTKDLDKLVKENLLFILSEMKQQADLAEYYGGDQMSFEDEMKQVDEFICDVGEYGIAYESIVVAAEEVPFVLSSKAAVKLLEVGLIMRFKTDRPIDKAFNSL